MPQAQNSQLRSLLIAVSLILLSSPFFGMSPSPVHAQNSGPDTASDERSGPTMSRKTSSGQWSEIFQPPGVNGTVHATSRKGDLIYVGGDFTEAGGVDARDLAVWDTQAKRWHSTDLDLDAMPNDSISALTVHDGRLYVGGHFQTYTGGFTQANIVSLENGNVQGFSGGLYKTYMYDGSVNAIVVRPTASGPEVYAAGDFTDASGTSFEGFARWNGSQWSAPGNLSNPNDVPGVGHALTLAGPDSIVVGGRFEEIQQEPATTQNIAAWNPESQTWHAYVEGVDGPVYDINTYERETQSGVRTTLYIGGNFSRSNAGVSLNNLAYWTGSRWAGVDGGVKTAAGAGPAIVYALTGNSYKLRVGGIFTQVGPSNLQAENVAAYTTSWESWNGTGRARDRSSVRTLYHDPNRDLTFVGGRFALAGNPTQESHRKTANIARWDDSNDHWDALGKGVERGAPVSALATASNGVYVGGNFDYVGGVPARNLARWRPGSRSWIEVGDGVSGPVESLALRNDGALFVGGHFASAEAQGVTTTVNNVAQWAGGQWSSLGSGTNAPVSALATNASAVYAGGAFSSPGQHVAKWNGTSWSSLGGGTGNSVKALTHQEGILYAGGTFTSVGGGQSAHRIARWTGSSWQRLGQGVERAVSSVEVTPAGEVYVGTGGPSASGGATDAYVARWHRGSWNRLDTGTDRSVGALHRSGRCQLYAGGDFRSAGGQDAEGIAAWNGTSWSSFSKRMTGSVSAIVTAGSDVYIGGDFSAITGPNRRETSSGFAQWRGGFPGSRPSSSVSILAPSTGPLYYKSPNQTVRAEVPGASKATFSYSTDGGSTWTVFRKGVNVNQDTAQTTWTVPVDSSASTIMIRAEATDQPCHFSNRSYQYLNPTNAGNKVTHLYRHGPSGRPDYFYPDENGYRFENDSSDVWPEPIWPTYGPNRPFVLRSAKPFYFPSWDHFVAAAGSSSTTGAAGNPRLSAVNLWAPVAGLGFQGACTGFAVTSLLAFENNSRVLDSLGLSPYDPLPTLSDDQGRRTVIKYFARQATGPTISTALANSVASPKATLKEVRTMLSQAPGPNRRLRYLSIWPVQQVDWFMGGHSVTPYRVEQDPEESHIWTIYVYDNNLAKDNRAHITINTKKNTWEYSYSVYAGEGYGGKGPGAGLFLVDNVQNYLGPQPLAPSLSSASSPPSVLGSPQRKAESSSLLDTHVRMLNTQGVDISVRDDNQRTIGMGPNGVTNEMLGKALPLWLRSGRKRPPVGFVVPNDRSYTIETSDFPGGDFSFTVQEQSTTYALERSDAEPEQTDRYSYGVGGLGLTNPDGRTKTYHMNAILSDRSDERAVTLDDLQLPQSDGGYVTLNRASSSKATGSGAVAITNEGPSTAFDLHLRHLRENGTTRFSSYDVALPSNAQLRVAPDWSALPDAPVTVEIDEGNDGSVDETRTLLNEPAAPTDLSASTQDEQIELQWSAPPRDAPAGYNVYRSATSFADSTGATRINEQLVTETAFVDTASLDGTHYYRVTAVGSNDGEGPVSNAAQIFRYPQTVNARITRSFGEARAPGDYRLVALPGRSDRSLESVVDGTPGTAWQAWWDDGSSANFLQEYDGSDRFSFQPGRGFWLTSTHDWTVDVRLPTVSLRSDTTTAISVHQGWNIVSNPLDRSIPWSAVEAVNEGALQPLWRFNGSFVRADSFRSAASGEAFYFLNRAGRDSLTIPYPTVFSPKGTQRGPAASTLTLTARSVTDTSATSTIRIGFDETAAPGLDRLDQPAPPGRFSTTSLRLLASEAPIRTRTLLAEWRPPSAGTNGGHTFTLQLHSATTGPVRLTTKRLEAGDDRAVALLHPRTGRSYDLEASSTVEVPAPDSTTFRLAIGTEAYVSTQKQKVHPEKVQFTAYPNPMRKQGTLSYALPEKSDVRILVYDVLGRRVALLEKGQKEAGHHRVRFDSANLSSGVYFGRLETDTRTLTQKITVVR